MSKYSGAVRIAAEQAIKVYDTTANLVADQTDHYENQAFYVTATSSMYVMGANATANIADYTQQFPSEYLGIEEVSTFTTNRAYTKFDTVRDPDTGALYRITTNIASNNTASFSNLYTAGTIGKLYDYDQVLVDAVDKKLNYANVNVFLADSPSLKGKANGSYIVATTINNVNKIYKVNISSNVASLDTSVNYSSAGYVIQDNGIYVGENTWGQGGGGIQSYSTGVAYYVGDVVLDESSRVLSVRSNIDITNTANTATLLADNTLEVVGSNARDYWRQYTSIDDMVQDLTRPIDAVVRLDIAGNIAPAFQAVGFGNVAPNDGTQNVTLTNYFRVNGNVDANISSFSLVGNHLHSDGLDFAANVQAACAPDTRTVNGSIRYRWTGLEWKVDERIQYQTLLYDSEGALLEDQQNQSKGIWYFVGDAAYLYNGDNTGTIMDYQVVGGSSFTDRSKFVQYKNQIFLPEDVALHYDHIGQAIDEGYLTAGTNATPIIPWQTSYIQRADYYDIKIPRNVSVFFVRALSDRYSNFTARYIDENEEWIGCNGCNTGAATPLPGPFGRSTTQEKSAYFTWVSFPVSKCDRTRTVRLYRDTSDDSYIGGLSFQAENVWGYSYTSALSLVRPHFRTLIGSSLPYGALTANWDWNSDNEGGPLIKISSNKTYSTYIPITHSGDQLLFINGHRSKNSDSWTNYNFRVRINGADIDGDLTIGHLTRNSDGTVSGWKDNIRTFTPGWNNVPLSTWYNTQEMDVFWAVRIPAKYFTITYDAYGNAIPTPQRVDIINDIDNDFSYMRGIGFIKYDLGESFVQITRGQNPNTILEYYDVNWSSAAPTDYYSIGNAVRYDGEMFVNKTGENVPTLAPDVDTTNWIPLMSTTNGITSLDELFSDVFTNSRYGALSLRHRVYSDSYSGAPWNGKTYTYRSKNGYTTWLADGYDHEIYANTVTQLNTLYPAATWNSNVTAIVDRDEYISNGTSWSKVVPPPVIDTIVTIANTSVLANVTTSGSGVVMNVAYFVSSVGTMFAWDGDATRWIATGGKYVAAAETETALVNNFPAAKYSASEYAFVLSDSTEFNLAKDYRHDGTSWSKVATVLSMTSPVSTQSTVYTIASQAYVVIKDATDIYSGNMGTVKLKFGLSDRRNAYNSGTGTPIMYTWGTTWKANQFTKTTETIWSYDAPEVTQSLQVGSGGHTAVIYVNPTFTYNLRTEQLNCSFTFRSYYPENGSWNAYEAFSDISLVDSGNVVLYTDGGGSTTRRSTETTSTFVANTALSTDTATANTILTNGLYYKVNNTGRNAIDLTKIL